MVCEGISASVVVQFGLGQHVLIYVHVYRESLGIRLSRA